MRGLIDCIYRAMSKAQFISVKFKTPPPLFFLSCPKYLYYFSTSRFSEIQLNFLVRLQLFLLFFPLPSPSVVGTILSKSSICPFYFQTMSATLNSTARQSHVCFPKKNEKKKKLIGTIRNIHSHFSC